jgi:hypothetical protein
LAGIGRKCELQRLYDEADDPALKLKIATEIRLAEGHAAWLLKDLEPKLPKATGASQQSRRAQRAANVRRGNGSRPCSTLT